MATTTGIRAGASASDGRLALVAEAAWGVTPANPAFKTMRFTSENLQPAKQTVRSNEIEPTRNVTDEIMVGRSVAGPLNFELSYETFDDLLSSLFHAEWTGDDDEFLLNGAGVGLAFTAERRLLLPAGTYEYHRFTGLVANTMSFQVQAGGIVTGNFGMMGKFGGRGTTAIAGSTYAAAPQFRSLNAASHFSNLSIPGISVLSPVRSLTLNITNNYRQQIADGSVDVIGQAPGRFEVTGSVEAYFKNGEMFQAFLDHADLGLEFTLGVEAGEQYKFKLPTITLTGEPGSAISGNDADIMQTMNFTAVKDRTGAPLAGTIQIEKILA